MTGFMPGYIRNLNSNLNRLSLYVITRNAYVAGDVYLYVQKFRELEYLVFLDEECPRLFTLQKGCQQQGALRADSALQHVRQGL